MTKIVVTTTFLGPVGLWSYIAQADKVYIEAEEHYQKRSYRNRALLLGANGLQQISVPLASGKNNRTPIRQVAISYDHDWIGPMLHTIRSAYGSAPYFEYYYDALQSILQTRHRTLWRLNQSIFEWLYQSIGLVSSINSISEYIRDYGAADYRRYNDKPVATIESAYEQVWADRHGHWKNLSVIDLLFCTGPESHIYLSNYNH